MDIFGGLGGVQGIINLLGMLAASGQAAKGSEDSKVLNSKMLESLTSLLNASTSGDSKATYGLPQYNPKTGEYVVSQRPLPFNQMAELDKATAAGKGRITGDVENNLANLKSMGDNLRTLNANQNTGLMKTFSEGGSEISNYYKNQLDKARGIVAGAGTQEVKDINRSYDARGNAINADLIARGVRSGSLSPSLQQGNLRERTDALGRLNDRLASNKLNVESTFGGQYGNVLNNLFGQKMGLQSGINDRTLNLDSSIQGNIVNAQAAGRGQITNWLNTADATRQNYGNNALAQLFSTLSGVNMPPPDMNPVYAAAAGFGDNTGSRDYAAQMAALYRKQTNPWNQIFSPIVGGTAAGVGAGAGTAAFGGMLGMFG